MTTTAVKRLTIYPLAIPMKRRISHAASQRAVSEPIVAAVELMGGAIGYGETLPRPYVTGESNESVIELLRGEFVKQLLAIRPVTFFDAIEAIDALPFLTEQGLPCPAARACLELALLDAYLREAGRSVSDCVGWMDLPAFGPPGSTQTIRYSMVLASESPESLARTARVAHLFGMRHFKLKVGFADDDARIQAVLKFIGRTLATGRGTLRLDANGAWSMEQALGQLQRWRDLPIAAIEQPLAKGAEHELLALVGAGGAPIYHDESLTTIEDAEHLHELGVAGGFNIRISKCGGLLPTIRLAAFARQRDIGIQLGCMVGETSILSAAQARVLECVPGVRFVEGGFGRLLMADDVTKRVVHFGLGGRPPRLSPNGLGAEVLRERIERHLIDKPIVIEL